LAFCLEVIYHRSTLAQIRLRLFPSETLLLVPSELSEKLIGMQRLALLLLLPQKLTDNVRVSRLVATHILRSIIETSLQKRDS